MRATIAFRGICRVSLPATALVTALVLAPAIGHALETEPPSTGSPLASCQPDTSRDPAAEPGVDAVSNAVVSGPTTGSQGIATTVNVTVPEGRLYLDRDRIATQVTGHRRQTLDPVLVADLRDEQPGWNLSVTLVELRVDGAPVDGTITVSASDVAPIVGERWGLRTRGDTIASTECASLVVADTGSGWGSFHVGISLEAHVPAAAARGDIDALLQLHVD